ncbi:MAG: hypothetical protein CTY16_14855 [Methylobacter sp.]|nr:MAG: hypothetical protein CTY16_14855 [Methylobacter sp.]
MPFTPLHMGPGAAIKAVLGQYFSLMVFGVAQIAMDIEPLVRIIRGDSLIHGFTHTYIGATLIGIATFVVGWPFCQGTLRFWNFITKPKFLRWLHASSPISKFAAFSGAFVGTFSHVFLDSIMHVDIHPWIPLNEGNSMLHFISVGWLHLFCVGLGVAGFMALFVIFVWNKIAIKI